MILSDNRLKKRLKKRIICSIIEVLLYFFVITISSAIISFNLPLYFLLPYWFFFFFTYYALIPKLTRGYTICGLCCGLKIVKIDGSEIKLWEYALRSVYAILFYVRSFGLSMVKSNKLGQFYFDKPFKTTVIGRKVSIDTLDEDMEDFTFYFLAE